jgi:hypothetical protein
MYTKPGGNMEDREKTRTAKSESIVELTPDMEVTDGSQVDIIDLTDIVDGPDEIPPSAAPGAETKPEAGPAASSTGHAISSAIENEVEAAFDFVQSPIQEAAPEVEPAPDHEGLMDKLSDIPRMVDDALDASGTPDAGTEAAGAQPVQPTGNRGADAPSHADRPLSGLDEEDEIIELTDIVDLSELEAAGLELGDDEEIIELTDIVDPAELETAGLKMDDEDDIIELTDIVDPSELRVGAVSPERRETGSAVATSEAPAAQTADAALEDEEYEDLLEMIDTLDADDLLEDIADLETPETEALSDAPEEIPTDPEVETPDDDQEYAQLLDTIDSLDPEDLLVSVDEAGLLDSDAGDAPPEQEGLLTLSEVLNRGAADQEQKPPVERVGSVIRDVEEETGKDVRTLTEHEVEAAVERILKTKYAETIERLIANAVEKAVNREIENLKRTMLDDD